MIFKRLRLVFGRAPNTEEASRYQHSAQFSNGVFTNASPPPPSRKSKPSFLKRLKFLWKFMRGVPNNKPSRPLQVIKVTTETLETPTLEGQILWFGHSSFWLQLDTKKILIDPVFSAVAAPYSWLGRNRYNKEPPIPLSELPEIDAVLISHDHYDHLDYPTIKALAHKTQHFFVPLGVASHLTTWGIPSERITELDWWEQKKLGTITLSFTPAQHFSGRTFAEQNTSLWGGWHLAGSTQSLFFSGDTGYGDHFKAIKQRYGNVDLALIECGQYNKRWPYIHMLPEQSVQAAQDLGAKTMMPIHWGAFTLAFHTWTDPIERAVIAANTHEQHLISPQIGELLHLSNLPSSYSTWWKAYQ